MYFARFAVLASTVAMAYTSAQSVPPSEEVYVTSPNTTTVWKAGTPVTVTWKYLLADGPFTNEGFAISLRKGDIVANTTAFLRALGESGRGVSSYSFDLPADIVNGSDYQIGVGSFSSESFVILGTAAPPASSPSASSSSIATPTTSGNPPAVTSGKPTNGASPGSSNTPLAIVGSILVTMAVALAL
ncbi:hypothetical protein BGZ95_005308 [Linnemannia exigua]|uniref:Yeast cell wall synthesis Kre9/Knh1-like N-terminal domain-containing protein n=1 Tax=Linnemannia exigua TaxID=604196 RepID=A0AAD4H7R4_9FUNG|nr:hypothetical protein BGZ95_005308 [Linnemannia exigua]